MREYKDSRIHWSDSSVLMEDSWQQRGTLLTRSTNKKQHLATFTGADMDPCKCGFRARQPFPTTQYRNSGRGYWLIQQRCCLYQERKDNMPRLVVSASFYSSRMAESSTGTFSFNSRNEKNIECCIQTNGIIRTSQFPGMYKRCMDGNMCVCSSNMDEAISSSVSPLQSNKEPTENVEDAGKDKDVVDLKSADTRGQKVASENSYSAGEGTLQGAIALITGTSIGAGILALPARTTPTGFVPTVITMGICWCFLVLEALLLAEVNVAILEVYTQKQSSKNNSRVVSLCSMAEETLGPVGGIFSAFIYCFLSYTLMVAYIARSEDILTPLMHTPPSFGSWIFTLVIGGLVFFGGTKLADYLNQMLTAGLIGSFVLIIMGGAAIANWSGLEHMDWQTAPQTFPVIFFTLVYHDLMPVLCTYLKGDRHHIRQAILLGSVVPFTMFVVWEAVILAIAPVSRNEDPVDFLMRLGGTGPALLIELFSILAVATSFIGTLLGFLEFFMERLSQTQKAQPFRNQPLMLKILFSKLTMVKPSTQSTPCISSECDCDGTVSSGNGDIPEDTNKQNRLHFNSLCDWCIRNSVRIASFILILVPPLVASDMVSDAFFSATDLAGGYGMTTLYGILPPAMAWSLYEKGVIHRKEQSGSFFALSEPCIKAILAGIGACAFGIIVNQLIYDITNFSSTAVSDHMPVESNPISLSNAISFIACDKHDMQ